MKSNLEWSLKRTECQRMNRIKFYWASVLVSKNCRPIALTIDLFRLMKKEKNKITKKERWSMFKWYSQRKECYSTRLIHHKDNTMQKLKKDQTVTNKLWSLITTLKPWNWYFFLDWFVHFEFEFILIDIGRVI